MKYKLLIVGMLFAMLIASCNSTAEVDAPATLSVSGSGTASTDPDEANIHLGVDTVDVDLATAVDQNSDQMNAIMTVLSDMGIEDKDIQTTNYNLWVEDVYDQNGQPTDEKRFRVSNMVTVRLSDLNQIGDLIANATEAGATNVSGINFGVADTTQLQQAALDNAIENAQEKAAWTASQMGFTLGAMKSLIEGGYYNLPMPVAAEAFGIGGGGSVPISQGQFSMSAQVQVVFELLPESD